MFSNDVTAASVTFGPFRLDLEQRLLYRDDVELTLGVRALDVVCLLAEKAGELVTKDELMTRAWHGVVVEEHNIQVQVWMLRKALGGETEGRRYIVTVPGRGYRLAHAKRHAPTSSASVSFEPRERPSIAVLPFTNMTDEPRYEDFVDGLVEDLITEFTRLRWLPVIARASSLAYKGRALDVQQIGRELGARYLIEGSIRTSERRVRMTAQLIEADTRAHLWAESFDCELRDVLKLQDQITRRIVAAIDSNIRAIEMLRAKAEPAPASPYALYMRALSDLYLQHPPNLSRAECLLERAIELDPGYADALAALAHCMLMRWMEGAVAVANMPALWASAIALARRAVFIDPTNTRALATAGFGLGTISFRYFDEAIELTRRAVALNPAAAYARNALGQVLAVYDDTKNALDCFEEARRLTPWQRPLMHNGVLTGVTMAHLFGGRFDEAVKWGQRVIADEPKRPTIRRFVAAALGHLGHREEAQAEIAEILRLQPTSSLARSRQVSFAPIASEIYVDGLQLAGLPER